MKISLICPSRNNLKYLKWSLNSIISNKGSHEVEFCVWDDFSDDRTDEWLESMGLVNIDNLSIKWKRNDGPNRLGHTILYDRIVKELATNDLCMIWHADMYLCPGALDAIEKLMYGRKLKSYERCELYETGKYTRSVKLGGLWGYWKDDQINDIDDPKVHDWLGRWAQGVPEYESINKNRIVSLTRIEPPLHPPGPEKIVHDFGTEPENFDEVQLLQFSNRFANEIRIHGHRVDKDLDENYCTKGVFAPWAFWKSEFLEIGGHDPLFAPQSKEDSDIWNRLLLNGTEFLQTWEGFVYHMTCRGSRFNPTLTIPGKNSKEWEEQNMKSTRNFIRKWGSMVKHDFQLHPIVEHKYNIGFIVRNCNYALLSSLEIWCDTIQCDASQSDIDEYIRNEQPNTKFNLVDRINPVTKKIPDVIVIIDGHQLSSGDMYAIQYLSAILSNSGVNNTEMELGSLKLNIGTLNHYENQLITVQLDNYTFER